MGKLINEIKNKETRRKKTIEKIKNIVSNLDQQRQKESTVSQNKMIDKADRLMWPKWVKVSEKEMLRYWV